MLLQILGKLGFDWKVALANLFNFFVIYLLLKNIVFKKIGEAIRDRQDKIKTGLYEAELAKTALLRAENEKEQILKKSHEEALLIVKRAELKKNEIIREAILLAETKVKEAEEKGRIKAENLVKEASDSLKKEYIDLLVFGLERVAKQKINREESEKFVLNLIK
jgi:F-type H+-transporting ATPase subunit b